LAKFTPVTSRDRIEKIMIDIDPFSRINGRGCGKQGADNFTNRQDRFCPSVFSGHLHPPPE
jgi:hypothetical protein